MFIPDRDKDGNPILAIKPFASKKIESGSLFKRVHGVSSQSIPAGQTANVDFVIPYPTAKFSGAEIFGTSLGDSVNFKVLDDGNGTFSGTPNAPLNQFGFGVKMKDGDYKNTSEYDADMYAGMILRCEYTNNSANAKVIYMNLELHEVKA